MLQSMGSQRVRQDLATEPLTHFLNREKSKRKKITPTQGLEGNQCEQFNSLLPIFYFLFAVLYLSMAIFTYNFYFTILS